MIMANFHDDYGNVLFYNRDDWILMARNAGGFWPRNTGILRLTSPAAGIFVRSNGQKKLGKMCMNPYLVVDLPL